MCVERCRFDQAAVAVGIIIVALHRELSNQWLESTDVISLDGFDAEKQTEFYVLTVFYPRKASHI